LDNPGGREAVRKQLIAKFNSLLGAEVIDQIYFSEFVIQ
jgi:flagellar basal body-associated protein FliL